MMNKVKSLWFLLVEKEPHALFARQKFVAFLVSGFFALSHLSKRRGQLRSRPLFTRQ